MKSNKPVAFRPDSEVSALVARLDACPSVNRSDVFNRAMKVGLPQVLEEIAKEAKRLGTVRG